MRSKKKIKAEIERLFDMDFVPMETMDVIKAFARLETLYWVMEY